VLESLAGLTTSVEGAVTARVGLALVLRRTCLGRGRCLRAPTEPSVAVRGVVGGSTNDRPNRLVYAYASLLQFRHPRPEAAAAANRRYGNGRPFRPGFVTVTECGAYRAPGHMARSGYVREAIRSRSRNDTKMRKTVDDMT
jgi:hypothetical protein